MPKSVRLCLIAVIVAAVFSVTYRVRACIPIGGVEPPCSAYWNADAVFVGSATDVTDAPPESNEIFRYALIHFAVEEPFRGVEGSEVEVAAVTGTDCDTKFQQGEKWLVYARRRSPDSRLGVSVGTKLYSRADDDLSYIRSSWERTSESSIIVRAFEYPGTPLEGMAIEIEGSGTRHQATTDKDGQVTFSALEPGRYTVRGICETAPRLAGARRPSRMEERGKTMLVEYQDNIQAGRCGYFEFFVGETIKKPDQR